MTPEHAPLPYDTYEVGTHNASGGFHLYLTDSNGRKIAAVWGRAEEKAFTGDLLKRAVNSHDALVKALEHIAALADEADEWDGRDKFRDCREIAHAALFNMKAASKA